MSVVRRHAIVRGRVQGVSFRASTQARAAQFGVAGFVRDLPDGTVEIEAEGDTRSVDALLAWAGEGPVHARVDAVDVRSVGPTGDHVFTVR